MKNIGYSGHKLLTTYFEVYDAHGVKLYEQETLKDAIESTPLGGSIREMREVSCILAGPYVWKATEESFEEYRRTCTK
jgi:hypothetical protein